MRSKQKPQARRGERRKAKRTPPYSTLNARQKAAYERTVNLVSELRADRGSYSKLLRKYHLDSRTARKYAGRNLRGGVHGKPVRASKADRLVRELWFPTSFGDAAIRTRSSRDATKLSEYFNDRDKLLGGKLRESDFEAKWHGSRIGGQELFADAAGIFRMNDADVLKIQDLYTDTGGEQ